MRIVNEHIKFNVIILNVIIIKNPNGKGVYLTSISYRRRQYR